MPRNALLSFLLATLAVAVPARAEEPATAEPPKSLATESLESCMARWDAKTHMTKDDWRRTCKRVSDERSEYLRKQGALPPKN
jgi:hypothetical protein